MRARAAARALTAVLGWAAGAAGQSFRVLPQQQVPVIGAPFQLEFNPNAVGPTASVRIVQNSSTPCAGSIAAGGDRQAVDATGKVGFTLSGDGGTYLVCLATATGQAQIAVGELDVQNVCFHPRIVFSSAERTTVRFNSATPPSAEFAISGSSSCHSATFWYRGQLAQGIAEFILPRPGFVCLLWHPDSPPAEQKFLPFGQIAMNPFPMSFLSTPTSPLRHGPLSVNLVGVPVEIPVPGSKVRLSPNADCLATTAVPAADVTLDDTTGTVAVFPDLDLPLGTYHLCVQSSLGGCREQTEVGSYIKVPGDVKVFGLTFAPFLLLAQRMYSVTFAGDIALYDKAVVVVDGRNCSAPSVVDPVSMDDQGQVAISVPRKGEYTVCVAEKQVGLPPPGEPPAATFIEIDHLRVLAPFNATPVTPPVLGTVVTLRIGGGADPSAEVKLSPDPLCDAVQAGPKAANNSLVQFPIVFAPRTYHACVRMTNATYWVHSGTVDVRPYRLLPEVFITERAMTVQYDEDTPQEGKSLTFVLRDEGIAENVCSRARTAPIAVAAIAKPENADKVTLPFPGLWDVCEMSIDASPLYLLSVSCIQPYTFWPYNALLHTPIVLEFGPTVPVGRSVLLVGTDPSLPKITEDDCQAVRAGTSNSSRLLQEPIVPGDRRAVIELLTANNFSVGVRYEVCVNLLSAGDGYFIPAVGEMHLHEMNTTHVDHPWKLVANVTRMLAVDGWPLEWEPSYTSDEPPTRVSVPRRLRVVRGNTDGSCLGGDGLIDELILDTSHKVPLTVEEGPVNTTLCVSVTLSPLLRGRTVGGVSYPSGGRPSAFIRAAFAIVEEPIVIDDKTPAPDGTWDDGSAIKNVPYQFRISGGAGPGSPVKITGNESCEGSVPGGEEIVLTPSLRANFTILRSGTFFICSALPGERFFARIGTIEVRELHIAEPSSLYAGGGERAVTIVHARLGGVRQVIAVEASTCPSALSSASVVPVAGPLNVVNDTVRIRLPIWSQGLELLLCAAVTPPSGLPLDSLVAVAGRLFAMPLPRFTSEPSVPTRYVQWSVSVTGAGPSPIVKIVVGSAAVCTQAGAAFAEGGSPRVAGPQGAAFTITEPEEARIQVCAAAADSPTYFAPAGGSTVQEAYRPRTLLVDRPVVVTFAPEIGAPSLVKLAYESNCDGDEWGPALMTSSAHGAPAEAGVVPPPQARFLCVASPSLDGIAEEERRAGTAQVSQDMLNVTWHEIGQLKMVPRFDATWSPPSVIAAGDSVTVSVDPPQYASDVVMLSNETGCAAPIVGGEPRRLTAANTAVFTIDNAMFWGLGVTLCVRTLDSAAGPEFWLPADGPSPLQLALRFPIPLIRCCSPVPHVVRELPVGYGELALSLRADCAGPLLNRAVIHNHTATLTVPVMLTGDRKVWTCMSGMPTGSVVLIGPPTFRTEPAVPLRHESFRIVVGHPTVDPNAVRVRVFAGAGSSCTGTVLLQFNSSAVARIVDPSILAFHVCAVLPQFPDVWIPITRLDDDGKPVTVVEVDSFEQTVDLAGFKLQSTIPFTVEFPAEYFDPPRRWIVRLHSRGDEASCNDTLVWGPVSTGADGTVVLLSTGPIRLVALCIQTVQESDTGLLDTGDPDDFQEAVSRAGPSRLLALVPVLHSWNITSVPPLIPALVRSPIHLIGNIANNTRVRISEHQNCSTKVVGSFVEGNRTGADGAAHVTVPPGVYHICAETVFPGDFVSAGEVTAYDAVASLDDSRLLPGADPYTACTPFSFLVTGVGVDPGVVAVTLEEGAQGTHGCSCDELGSGRPPGDEARSPAMQEATSAVVTVARGVALNATFVFPFSVEVPLLLCVKTPSMCLELVDLPSGVSQTGCLTPQPTTLTAGGRIGGAFDRADDERSPLWLIVVLCVAVPLCCSVLVAVVAWWQLSSPDRKRKERADEAVVDTEPPTIESLFAAAHKKTQPPLLLQAPAALSGVGASSHSNSHNNSAPLSAGGGFRRPLSAFSAPAAPARDVEGSQLQQYFLTAGAATARPSGTLAAPPASVGHSPRQPAWRPSAPRGGGGGLPQLDRAGEVVRAGDAGTQADGGMYSAMLGSITLDVPSTVAYDSSHRPLLHQLQPLSSTVDTGQFADVHAPMLPSPPPLSPPPAASPYRVAPRSPPVDPPPDVSGVGCVAALTATPSWMDGATVTAVAVDSDALARRWAAAQRQQREALAEQENDARHSLREEEDAGIVSLLCLEHSERRVEPLRRRNSRLRSELQGEEHGRALREHAQLVGAAEEAERADREEERKARAAAIAKRQQAARDDVDLRSALQTREDAQHERDERERRDGQRALLEQQREALERERAERRREKEEAAEKMRALQEAFARESAEARTGLESVEAAGRAVVAGEEDSAAATVWTLLREGADDIARLLLRAEQEREAREKECSSARGALLAFEDVGRAKEAAQEKTERERLREEEEEAAAKREQIALLLEAQRDQDLARREEAAKKQEEEEEARKKLEQERADLALERQRVEEDKALVAAERRAQAEEEHRRRAAQLKRQAEEDERLREESLQLAQRANAVRAGEERARQAAEEERRKLKDERRRLEEAMEAAEKERQERERLAIEAERRRIQHEQAVAKQQERTHQQWMDRVAVTQEEGRCRSDAVLAEHSGWSALLVESGEDAARAARAQGNRVYGDRVQGRMGQTGGELGGDFYQSNRVQRLKESSAELMQTLTQLTPGQVPAPAPFSAQAVQVSMRSLSPPPQRRLLL